MGRKEFWNLDEKSLLIISAEESEYYLGTQFEPWWSARGNPKEEKIQWLAVSVNTLQGAYARLTPDFTATPPMNTLAGKYNNPTERAGTQYLFTDF